MTLDPATLPERTDVAIVGGGMVGLSLALLLARSCPELSVVVIEAHAFSLAGDLEQPSFDARCTAVSESSRAVFEHIGVWARLASLVAPITTVHVSDRGKPGITRLEAAEQGLEGLGFVVENRVLGQVLMAAVSDCPAIRIVAPLRVERLVPDAKGMVIESGDQRCLASLAVVAEGAGSTTLEQLGIHTRVTDYGQSALIANIGLERPHAGVAYERFTDQGPLALLPLPDAGGEHRAALVWTLPPTQAQELASAPEEVFLAALQERFGYRAGTFVRRGQCSTYSLRLSVAEEQVRRHLAVVGNAAHFLHPVAGQGFNLALRDVARLVEAVVAGWRRDLAPGDLAVLEDYLSGQEGDQWQTILFSDSLPRTFATGGALPALRSIGLITLDLVPALRTEFARFGAGLAVRAARLPRFAGEGALP